MTSRAPPNDDFALAGGRDQLSHHLVFAGREPMPLEGVHLLGIRALEPDGGASVVVARFGGDAEFLGVGRRPDLDL